MNLLKAYSGLTHQGPYLHLNEDSYFIDIKNKLYMIFDGFGGHGIGDICVKEMIENVKRFYGKIEHDLDATMPFFFSPQYLLEGNALINSAYFAHRQLCFDNAQKEMAQRGGASGILVAEAEEIVTLLSVGNCRAYLFRQQQLEKIFVEENYFSFNQIKEEQSFNIPSNAFGLFEELRFQVKEIKVREGDIIALLSDGIYLPMIEEDLKNIFNHSSWSLPIKAKKLMEESNSRGNMDNQTVIFLQY